MVVKTSPEVFLLVAPVTGISVPSGVTKVINKACLKVMAAPVVEAVPMAPDRVMVVPLMAVTVAPVSVVPR